MVSINSSPETLSTSSNELISIGKNPSQFFSGIQGGSEDSISGRGLKFLNEVNSASSYLADKGYYTHNDNKYSSKVLESIVGILLSILMFFILYKVFNVPHYVSVTFTLIFFLFYVKIYVLPWL